MFIFQTKKKEENLLIIFQEENLKEGGREGGGAAADCRVELLPAGLFDLLLLSYTATEPDRDATA